jgi:hypothetical protein
LRLGRPVNVRLSILRGFFTADALGSDTSKTTTSVRSLRSAGISAIKLASSSAPDDGPALPSGRGNDWVKKTCAQRETLPIAGFALKKNKFDGIYVGRGIREDL